MSGFIDTPFFGIVLSMFAYFFGQKMQKKFKFPLCNTMLVAGFLIIGVLLILNVSHETYNQGGTILSLMVNPATMCLSLGIYDKWELLKKNAAALRTGSVAVAQEAERGIVDLETLVQTNQELISTLEEVRQIQETGRARRAEAELELGRLEGELKHKLLEMKG